MSGIRRRTGTKRLPRAEALELRMLLAGFLVDSFEDTVDTNLADAFCQDAFGNCSLRAAVQQATAHSGPDQIELPSGTFILGGGSLAIDGDLIIRGSSSTIVDAEHRVNVFDVAGSDNVVLRGFTIRNGLGSGIFHTGSGLVELQNMAITAVQGGAVVTFGPMVINDSTISQSETGVRVDAAGSLALTRSTITDNVAGGITNFGSSQIRDSFFTNNSVVNASTGSSTATMEITNTTVRGVTGASGVRNTGNLTIEDSLITNNATPEHGGGIRNSAPGSLTLIGTTVSGNTAERSGGGIFNQFSPLNIVDSTIDGNRSGGTREPGNGGGILHNGGTLTVTNSTISHNEARLGTSGGISNIGIATISNSTISGNLAQNFAGITTGHGNVLNLSDSTVTANRALTPQPVGRVDGINTTPFLAPFLPGGTANLRNTIVAGNGSLDCAGPVNSQGNNLIQRSLCAIVGDTAANLLGIDPLLGPLQDNGGPTQTHSLTNTSPAVDAAHATNFATSDQRGVARPQGTGPDIGAFELAGGPQPVFFDLPTTPGSFTLQLRDSNIELTDSSLTVLFAEPFEDVLALTINGPAGQDDKLIVDFNSGNPLPAAGLTFNGGGGGFDVLEINGGTHQTVVYTATASDSGMVDLDGLAISYTGLEPVVDHSSAAERIFTIDSAAFPGDHQIRLTNDPATAGNSLIESSGSLLFEKVSFANPSASLTINAGSGDNLITITPLDSDFAASIQVNGEDGDDLVDISSFASDSISIDGGLGNNVVVEPSADLEILDLSLPKVLVAGTSQKLKLAILNNGVATATGVTWTANLPPAVELGSGTDGCTQTGDQIECDLGSIASGETENLTLGLEVPSSFEGDAAFLFRSSVASETPDNDLTNNIVGGESLVVRHVDLSIHAAEAPPTLAGSQVSLPYTVINDGPSDASGLTLAVALDAGVSFDSANHSNCSLGGTDNLVECSLGSIESQSQTTVTLLVTTPSDQASISNSAIIESLDEELDPSDNDLFETIDLEGFQTSNVDLFLVGSRAVLRGDSADNQVFVEIIPRRRLRVTGLEGTTLNRALAPLELTGVRSLTIATFSGNDYVAISSNHSTVLNRIDVRTHNGSDQVEINRANVRSARFVTGRGGDRLAITDSALGSLLADTGPGDDFLQLDSVRVRSRTNLRTSVGSDQLFIDNSRLRLTRVSMGQGDDLVQIETAGDSGGPVSHFDLILLSTGRGDDTIRIGRRDQSGNSALVGGIGFLPGTQIDGGRGSDSIDAGLISDGFDNLFSGRRIRRIETVLT